MFLDRVWSSHPLPREDILLACRVALFSACNVDYITLSFQAITTVRPHAD